jgi:hypothetical protein
VQFKQFEFGVIDIEGVMVSSRSCSITTGWQRALFTRHLVMPGCLDETRPFSNGLPRHSAATCT